MYKEGAEVSTIEMHTRVSFLFHLVGPAYSKVMVERKWEWEWTLFEVQESNQIKTIGIETSTPSLN